MTDPRCDMRGAADTPCVEIGIGELALVAAPGRLMTPAVGSCVAVAINDAFSGRGGLAHVMLPTAPDAYAGEMPGRFADTAIPELIRLLMEAGSLRHRLEAKIAGGAAMFKGESPVASIGERNIAEVKRQLALTSIPLLAEDTGESHARTVEFTVGTGELVVRSYRYGVVRL